MCPSLYRPFGGTEKALVQRSKAYKHAREIIDIAELENKAQKREYDVLQRQIAKEDEALKREYDALQRQIVNETLQRIQHNPIPRSVQCVSKMFDNLLPSQAASASSAQSESLHDQIQELIEPIKPYIYGSTPMCKALDDATAVFEERKNTNPKILFILSDGKSTDGDPLPFARKLHDSGVTMVTCFLTSDKIQNPRRLFDSGDRFQDRGRQVMFEMSSTMKNTHTPLSYLVDAKWELPPSGESHLFVQANSLDTVNEFCRIVVSQLTKSCDALVHLLNKVDLADLINLENAEFKPKKQGGETCYANAIAAVFHLAMKRIVGRDGGVPDFKDILTGITDKYGVNGANTQKVLEEVCPKYRLHFHKVNETGARQAINHRRPVISRFRLYDEQWPKFSKFYKKTKKGILNKSDITCEF